MNRLTDTLLPVGETLLLDGRSLFIEHRLSAGLTGEVYKGTLHEPEQQPFTVAVKAMKSLEFEAAALLFQQEMLTLARMKDLEREAGESEHSELRIAPGYYGRGQHNDVPFFMMEFIEGTTIPDLLRDQEKLPELQSLTAGWHLYRTLHIMHTGLKKTYIDLKFENLWWVGSSENGQLKLTDFGTLEDIKGDSYDLEDMRAQRGIQRDLLLSGVYLFAMLTGHTLSYSLGNLLQPAEHAINQSLHLSWGTRQLLREILHRNPNARPKTGLEIARRLYNLKIFWEQDQERLREFASRRLDRAQENLLAAQTINTNVAEYKEVARREASEARAALDILRLQGKEERQELDNLIQQADKLLEATDYIERGRALLEARSYPGARKAFEEGRDWSSDVIRLSWWSYIARIGESVESSIFTDKIQQEVIAAVHLMEQNQWIHAERRLESLANELNIKGVNPKGLEYLQIHCELFKYYYRITANEHDLLFSERAKIFEKILEQQARLPESEQQYLISEIGDLRPAYEADLNLAESKEASEKDMQDLVNKLEDLVSKPRKGVIDAHDGVNGTDKENDDYKLRDFVKEAEKAFLKYPESPKHSNFIWQLAEKSLGFNAYRAALEMVGIGLKRPDGPQRLRSIQALARSLYKAERALADRNSAAFESALTSGLGQQPGHPAVKHLLTRAIKQATKEKDLSLLRVIKSLTQNNFPQNVSQVVDEIKQITALFEQDAKEIIKEADVILSLISLEEAKAASQDINLSLRSQQIYKQQPEQGIRQAQKLLDNSLDLANLSGNIELIVDIEKKLKLVKEKTKELEEAAGNRIGEGQKRKQALVENYQKLTAINTQITADDHLQFLIECELYLQQVDAEDEEVAGFKREFLNRTQSLSKQELESLKKVSAEQLDAIEAEFKAICSYFESNQLEQARASLVNYRERYGNTEEVRDLEAGLRLVSEWQQVVGNSLDNQLYERDLLKQLRSEKWLPFPLPQVYLEPVIKYLEQAKNQARQTTIERMSNYRSSQFVQSLRQWFDLEMTQRQLNLTLANKTGDGVFQAESDGHSAGQDATHHRENKKTESTKKAVSWNIQNFLVDVRRACHQKDRRALEVVIKQSPTLAVEELENSLVDLNEHNWQQAGYLLKRSRPSKWSTLRIVGAAMLLAVLGMAVILTIIGVWFWNNNGTVVSAESAFATVVAGVGLGATTQTPTPTLTQTPTQTPTETSTPTPSQTPTSTPTPTTTPTLTPTSTPEPIACAMSVFCVDNPEVINPPAPSGGSGFWLLPFSTAEVSPPPIEENGWLTISAEQSDNIGDYQYLPQVVEPVQINWYKDQVLQEGLYNLYVLDTHEHSTGSQTFEVRINDEAAFPRWGTNSIIFNDIASGQLSHDWLSIGIYEIERGQRLSVHLTAEAGNYSLAIPQLLLVKLQEPELLMISDLPEHELVGRPLYSLLDDTRATFYVFDPGSGATSLSSVVAPRTITSTVAWNGSYQIRDLQARRDVAARIEWAPLGQLPAGEYELRVWVPPDMASVVVEYDLFSPDEGVTIQRDNAAIPPPPASSSEGYWETLGTWRWCNVETAPIGVRLTTTVAGNRAIDPGFSESLFFADAVVLLHVRGCD